MSCIFRCAVFHRVFSCIAFFRLPAAAHRYWRARHDAVRPGQLPAATHRYWRVRHDAVRPGQLPAATHRDWRVRHDAVRPGQLPAATHRYWRVRHDAVRPGRVFAKCLLNFGLRPDRPAGIRHRQPMGDRQLRTVACDITQRRSAL